MTDQRSYPAGVPCWIDLEAPDVGAAVSFYGGLFGWTFADAIPATAAAVCAAGGSLSMEPQDAGPGGRRVDCLDPRGAQFRLWQPYRRLGVQATNVPNSWNFSDLHTGDTDAAQRFYGPLFGWMFDDIGFATLVRRTGYGEHLAATVDPGIHERQSAIEAPAGFADAVAWLIAQPGGTEHWHVTFAVADRDGSAAAAEKHGATVLSAEATDWTKTATVRDPQGAVLTLSQFLG